MSAPRPIETDYLAAAEAALTSAVASLGDQDTYELRLQILEATAARFGGFDLGSFHKAFGIRPRISAAQLLDRAAPVAAAIERTPIHHALALSALAREALCEKDRKTTGAYHTDFRLAERLAQLAAPTLTHVSKVVDPACGAGILLAALTSAVCGRDRSKTAHWIAHGVYAADLSPNSLRAALLSLSSFTDDLEALRVMRTRWYCGDSLTADRHVWAEMAPSGFDAVIGNPPWEKVKLSRHEFLKSSGTERHYGAEIEHLDETQFVSQRNETARYARELLARYPDLGDGEPDLYVAFTDLFFSLCREGGVVAALIPGGFIRSQGTKSIRQKIFDGSQSISVSIIDNRAKFFAIDTRFKFLAIAFTKAAGQKWKREPIRLLHERGTSTGLEVTGSASIGRAALGKVRGDLSLPEVRNVAEWRLFCHMMRSGVAWDAAGFGWTPKFCREVDMTKERPKFLGRGTPNTLPLVEGRMVQAHRFGAKGHVSGTGRKALWVSYPIGGSKLSPQFWIRRSDVPRASQDRTDTLRAGFCDIAGQTNERSLMAAVIPAGVACGNKVPTIIFPEDPSTERLLVWVAIANSFAFDWMLRRVLTTTVNYFLLQSIALPKVAQDGLPWKRLCSAAQELQSLDRSGNRQSCSRIAQLRAEIDAEVAVAYGLSLKDMQLVMRDFPLLDRGQIPLPGEKTSTITRDTVLAAVAKRTGESDVTWCHRATQAHALGSVAYVPSELALGYEDRKEQGVRYHG